MADRPPAKVTVARVEATRDVVIYHLSNRWFAVEDPRSAPPFTLYRPPTMGSGEAVWCGEAPALPSLLDRLNGG